MIERIGCFHFVENYTDPFAALRGALSEHGDVSDSLLVLPEAFNNGRPYYDVPRGQPFFSAKDALRELGTVAAQKRVVLVAGVLAPPFSSAYLIDDTGARLLCHKKSEDGSGHYEPCPAGSNDGCNPVVYEGLGLGVLICNEIDHYADKLSLRLGADRSTRRLICIPAWMSAHYFGTDRLMSDHWDGNYVVLANANPYGCGSFIADSRRQSHRVMGQTNRIVFKAWEELDRV